MQERASDFLEVKNNFDNAVGTIKAAINGLEAMEKVVSQMKATALSARAESNAANRLVLQSQYNSLYDQLAALSEDASFQGQSLISTNPNTLDVKLSPAGSGQNAVLTVPGKSMSPLDANVDIHKAGAFNTVDTINAGNSGAAASNSAWTTWAQHYFTFPTDHNWDLAAVAEFTSITNFPISGELILSGGNIQITAGGSIDANSVTPQNVGSLINAVGSYFGYTVGSGFSVDTTGDGVADGSYTSGSAGWNIELTLGNRMRDWNGSSYQKPIDFITAELDRVRDLIRTETSNLGRSIDMLKVREEFTKNSVNVLLEGEQELSGADLSEEGANLVSIETRAQLSMQALRFSGQQTEGILALFR